MIGLKKKDKIEKTEDEQVDITSTTGYLLFKKGKRYINPRIP
jgi:hypothetical protein